MRGAADDDTMTAPILVARRCRPRIAPLQRAVLNQHRGADPESVVWYSDVGYHDLSAGSRARLKNMRRLLAEKSDGQIRFDAEIAERLRGIALQPARDVDRNDGKVAAVQGFDDPVRNAI